MASKLRQLWWLMLIFAVCNIAIAFLLYQNGKRPAGEEVKHIVPKSVYSIGILESTDLPEQETMASGVVAGLKAAGWTEGKNLKIETVKVKSSSDQLASAVKTLASENKDLLIAVGSDSAKALAKATQTIPVVGVGVMNFRKEAAFSGQSNFTGISDMPAILSQIRYAAKCIKIENVGFFYDSTNPESVLQLQILRKVAERKGLKLYEVDFHTDQSVGPQIKKMIGHVDAVYIPEDKAVLAHFDEAVDILTGAGIPVIGEQSEMVKRGALLSVSPDYYRMGFGGGRIAAELLKGKLVPSDIPIEEQNDPNLVVNMKQVKALRIELPSDVWQQARKFYLYDKLPARP